MPKILLVPSARPGNGIGHLRRCLDLAAALPSASLLVPESEAEARRFRDVAAREVPPLSGERMIDFPAGERWDLVCVDRRQTDRRDYLRFATLGPIVAIDEGGAARALADYLIDTLPPLDGTSPANVRSTGFLSMPANVRDGARLSGSVLVTFGGEDGRGLSSALVEALVGGGFFRPELITVAIGPLAQPAQLPPGVATLVTRTPLREELYRYDLVFTSFGLTAYEALGAKVDVLLLNPTRYHQRLGRLAGFTDIGLVHPNPRLLAAALGADGLGHRRSPRPEPPRSLSAHIADLRISFRRRCPCCEAELSTAIGRFDECSFFRCGSCGMCFQVPARPTNRGYDRDYFFQDYRAQYGKTYLEDFDAIKSAGARRLRAMARHLRGIAGRRLLDAGCAFGPFLVAARDAGAVVHGLDVVAEPVNYVRSVLRIPCAQSSFEAFEPGESFGIEQFDVLSMWYVIEHFPDLVPVLLKVNRLLVPGGLFGFSTPNLSGISATRNLREFLRRSPRDHFTLWSPRTARRVLRRFGFRVVGIRITGHHPERFRAGAGRSRLARHLVGVWSRIAGLGDTFEIYAVKKEDL